jgi:hypothetical protein
MQRPQPGPRHRFGIDWELQGDKSQNDIFAKPGEYALAHTRRLLAMDAEHFRNRAVA